MQIIQIEFPPGSEDFLRGLHIASTLQHHQNQLPFIFLHLQPSLVPIWKTKDQINEPRRIQRMRNPVLDQDASKTNSATAKTKCVGTAVECVLMVYVEITDEDEAHSFHLFLVCVIAELGCHCSLRTTL